MMLEHWILEGKEVKKVDLMTWAKWFEDGKNRIIKQEDLADGNFVSTVFLGIDHNFGMGEPLIFETMVFDKDRKELDMKRYSTYQQAEDGHKFLVLKWSNL